MDHRTHTLKEREQEDFWWPSVEGSGPVLAGGTRARRAPWQPRQFAGGVLSKVLKGQLLSGMMGEPVPSSSPQSLFGGARTPSSATFIDHVTFHKPGNYKLGSG